MNKVDFIIPFGFRCNAASVLTSLLKFYQPVMIFDWVQMTEKTMLEIISLDKNDVSRYFDEYFAQPFTYDSKHSITNDWLPHDIKELHNNIDKIKQKYIKRTQVFLEHIGLEETKVFLTVVSFTPSEHGMTMFDNIRNRICSRINDRHLFLTINYGLNNIDTEKHKNLRAEVPTWKEFDDRIKEWIVGLDILK